MTASSYQLAVAVDVLQIEPERADAPAAGLFLQPEIIAADVGPRVLSREVRQVKRRDPITERRRPLPVELREEIAGLVVDRLQSAQALLPSFDNRLGGEWSD